MRELLRGLGYQSKCQQIAKSLRWEKDRYQIRILNGSKVEWAIQWKYLGVTLKSGKQFNCSVTDRIKKFYRCANSILRIDGRSNDMVMMCLIEAHCIPYFPMSLRSFMIGMNAGNCE